MSPSQVRHSNRIEGLYLCSHGTNQYIPDCYGTLPGERQAWMLEVEVSVEHSLPLGQELLAT